jgi:hypothetical protein
MSEQPRKREWQPGPTYPGSWVDDFDKPVPRQRFSDVWIIPVAFILVFLKYWPFWILQFLFILLILYLGLFH